MGRLANAAASAGRKAASAALTAALAVGMCPAAALADEGVRLAAGSAAAEDTLQLAGTQPGGGLSVQSGAADEEESNNTFDTAEEIKLNTTIYGTIDSTACSGHNGNGSYGCDFFKVICPINGTLRITFWNGEYYSGGYRLAVNLYSSTYGKFSEYAYTNSNVTTPVYLTHGVSAGEMFYLHVSGNVKMQPYHFKIEYVIGATDITSTTPGAGSFKVAWTKKAKASFYQVRYVRESVYEDYGWSKASTKKVASSKGACTVSGLASNAKYRTQVRVARTIDGETYYSDWSDEKLTKTVTSISKTKVKVGSAGAYTGSAKKPSVKVTYGKKTLKRGTHYTLSYKNNVKAGTATVTVKGKGYYVGKVAKKFTIARASISKAKVTGVKAKRYTGKAQTQLPTLKVGKRTLKAGRDYVLSYKNNVNAGTATMTVKGKGNYKGTISRKFIIYR